MASLPFSCVGSEVVKYKLNMFAACIIHIGCWPNGLLHQSATLHYPVCKPLACGQFGEDLDDNLMTDCSSLFRGK